MKANKTKEMVLTALLIAIGIIIPVYFGFLRVILPPAFTATLMSHVPIFIAMFISPWSALFTALGTTLGFAFAGLNPVVTARAASHIIFALIGAFMIKKRCSLANTGIVVTVIHALCEALTVFLFIKFGLMAVPEGSTIINASFYVVGIGTFIHSAIDYGIACLIGAALAKAHIIPTLTSVWMNK